MHTPPRQIVEPYAESTNAFNHKEWEYLFSYDQDFLGSPRIEDETMGEGNSPGNLCGESTSQTAHQVS